MLGAKSMFSIFNKKYKNGMLLLSEKEFWRRLESESTPREVFDNQGEAHGDIDLRLVEKIEAFLVPILGQWEQSERWFHNIDYYGDGIRSLSFNWHLFQPEFIPTLQAMLVGEHEPFCILCQFHEDLSNEASTKIGSMAIFSKKIMVSNNVAKKLVLVA